MVTKHCALATLLSLVAACGGGGGGNGSGGAAGGPASGASAGGRRTAAQQFYPTPVRVSETLKFTAIAAGYHHVCAIGLGGDTYCWGFNEHGQLGNSSPMETCVDGMFPCSSVPVRVEGGVKLLSLVASERHTCGLDALGAAHCWGFGLGGQLGDGLRANSAVPVAVSGALRFTALTAGAAGGATCGLTAAGDAWCWGINVGGELGNGTKTDLSAVPSPLATSLKLISISIGQQHACAVDTAGNPLCWGNNWYGQLGVGSAGGDRGIAESFTPVAVLGGQKFHQIVAAGMHSCALQSSGDAYCWGLGSQLGAANAHGYEALPLPVVTAGSKWIALSRGYGQTCALTQDGELYCWGHRTAIDPLETAEAPLRIASSQAFVAFSAGGTHACAIGADAFAYCWGSNSWGQVGRPPSDP